MAGKPSTSTAPWEQRFHAPRPLWVDWFDAGHGHGATDTRVAWCRRSIEFVERALGIEAASPA